MKIPGWRKKREREEEDGRQGPSSLVVLFGCCSGAGSMIDTLTCTWHAMLLRGGRRMIFAEAAVGNSTVGS